MEITRLYLKSDWPTYPSCPVSYLIRASDLDRLVRQEKRDLELDLRLVTGVSPEATRTRATAGGLSSSTVPWFAAACKGLRREHRDRKPTDPRGASHKLSKLNR